MKQPLQPPMWSYIHRLNIFVTILTFSLVNSFRGTCTATKGYQCRTSTTACNLNPLNENENNANEVPLEYSGSAFKLSGSICGQPRDYALDNLDCNKFSNEIKFCGKLMQ